MIRFSPPQMLPHPLPACKGDRALLVLADSRGNYTDTSLVMDTVLVALRHLGLPYRLHNLALAPLTPALLAGCAGVVIAQSRLCANLDISQAELVRAAVEEQGVGLVNLDGDLPHCPPPLLGLLGLEVDPLPFASDTLLFNGDPHAITAGQPAGAQVRLKKPLTFANVRRMGRQAAAPLQAVLGKEQLIFSRHHVAGTAYEPGHYPALMAGASGGGRVVQFAFSPRLWHPEFFGHAMGLDALFWRAIAWAARKPFAAQKMPPYVTLRLDDASGRHDLRYVDVMNAHGHHPLISCFVEAVPEDLGAYMRRKQQAGQVDWDAHALNYYDLIPFEFGRGEYTPERLDAIFAQVDAWYAARGITPPCTAYFHWGEVGVRALPYLKQRGRRFLFSPYHPGQLKWERTFPNWWPYRLNSLFYDYLPEDPELYNIGASLPRHLMAHDVLTGCTQWSGESAANDMDKAAERAAYAVRLALDSGFFAEIGTHEQKFAVLGLEEIDRWLNLLDQKLAGVELRKVGHEQAARYTRARDESWLSSASIAENGQLSLALEGVSPVAQELAVFEDAGDEIACRWVEIPAFQQPTSVEI